MHRATLQVTTVLALLLLLACASVESAPSGDSGADEREQARLDDARELLSPVEHALRATRQWPLLRTQPASADHQELRFWRFVGATIHGLALSRVQGRFELKQIRLRHCERMLAADGTPYGDVDPCLQELGIPALPDGERVYRLEAQAQQSHSTELTALWFDLLREITPEFLNPTDGCNRRIGDDGRLWCLFSITEVLDIVEWADGENYYAVHLSLDVSPNQAAQFTRMLAIVDRHLGSASTFKVLGTVPDPPRILPSNDCSACEDFDKEQCDEWLARARVHAKQLLPPQGPELSVLRCEAEAITASFPIPETKLARPPYPGAPAYPGARHYAHVRFNRSDGAILRLYTDPD